MSLLCARSKNWMKRINYPSSVRPRRASCVAGNSCCAILISWWQRSSLNRVITTSRARPCNVTWTVQLGLCMQLSRSIDLRLFQYFRPSDHSSCPAVKNGYSQVLNQITTNQPTNQPLAIANGHTHTHKFILDELSLIQPLKAKIKLRKLFGDCK